MRGVVSSIHATRTQSKRQGFERHPWTEAEVRAAAAVREAGGTWEKAAAAASAAGAPLGKPARSIGATWFRFKYEEARHLLSGGRKPPAPWVGAEIQAAAAVRKEGRGWAAAAEVCVRACVCARVRLVVSAQCKHCGPILHP